MLVGKPDFIKNNVHYYADLDLDSLYQDKVDDTWDVAGVYTDLGWGDIGGAEYNYCFDGKEDNSAIYKTDGEDTYTDDWVPYEIDFDDPAWKQKLIDKMIECIEEWYLQEDDYD